MRHACVRRNILFFESSPGFGGSVGSLGNLLRHLDAERYHAYCVVSHPAHHAFLKSCVPAVPVIIDKAHTLTTRRGMGGWIATPFHVFGKPGRRACYATMCFVNWLGPVHSFARRIQSIFAQTKFDAVWLNNGPGNGFGVGALLARRWQVPLFCKVQGFQPNNPVTRWLARPVDHFLPDSEAVASSLRALGVPDQRITVTYCPVDAGKYDAARVLPTGEFRRKGDAGHSPTFGIVGMLQEWKGQHVFLHAAKKVLERVLSSVAVIVGDSPDGSAEYPAYLRNLAAELGIAQRVVFTGYRGGHGGFGRGRSCLGATGAIWNSGGGSDGDGAGRGRGQSGGARRICRSWNDRISGYAGRPGGTGQRHHRAAYQPGFARGNGPKGASDGR